MDFNHLIFGKPSWTKLVRIPDSCCCCCGEQVFVTLRETYLQQRGYRHVYSLDFPYCAKCMSCIGRHYYAWSEDPIVKMAATLTGVFVLAAMWKRFVDHKDVDWQGIAVTCTWLVGSIVFRYRYSPKFLGIRWFCPIELNKVESAWGELTQLTMSFYNPIYAQAFADANLEWVQRGVLTVRVRHFEDAAER